MRRISCVFLALCLLLIGGCDLLDPARPTAQPDTEVFGNLLDVSPNPDDPNLWTLQIRVGPPRALRAAEEEVGNPTPSVEQGLVATVTVGADTVVIVDGEWAEIEDIPAGTEVVVVPVPGTTQIRGSSDLRLVADTLVDFMTYSHWKLPKLVAVVEEEIDDPQAINSSGSELAPVPLAGGRVLYFSAHLRPPATGEGDWHGALREGLSISGEGEMIVERSYRTELTEEGWTEPELVVFPGLENVAQQRISWVSEDETISVVTVQAAGEPPWVGLSERANESAPWGEPGLIEGIGSQARDAVYLPGKRSKMVFGSDRGGRERDDLFLFDPDVETGPMPLQPEICTFGLEWNPRIGPQGELFFCREDRQLLLQGGQVRPLRLPGSHRIPFTQAAATGDGEWVFLCVPKYRPLMYDENIYVAPVGDDWSLGSPVPVDDWRP